MMLVMNEWMNEKQKIKKKSRKTVKQASLDKQFLSHYINCMFHWFIVVLILSLSPCFIRFIFFFFRFGQIINFCRIIYSSPFRFCCCCLFLFHVFYICFHFFFPNQESEKIFSPSLILSPKSFDCLFCRLLFIQKTVFITYKLFSSFWLKEYFNYLKFFIINFQEKKSLLLHFFFIYWSTWLSE